MLIEWRETVGEEKLDPQEWRQKIDEAVSVAAPLFVLALSAVDSEIDSVRDQRGLIQDFLSIENWVSSGLTAVASVPECLAYLYHNLLGAMLVDSGHHREAIGLLMTNVRYSRASISEPLWVRSDLTGWPAALGGNCNDAWKYLSELPTSCSWVAHFFTSDRSFTEAIRAYLLLGSLLELGHAIKSQTNLKDLAQLPRVQVPPWFLLTESTSTIVDKAVPSRDVLAELAARNDVDPQALRDHWNDWCRVLASWTSSVGFWHLPFRDSIPELP